MLQAPPKDRGRSSRRSRRRSRHHRAWYRKKRFMFPIVFLFMFMTAGGSAAWYVTAKFSAFNSLSAPPLLLNGEMAPAQLVLDGVKEGKGSVYGIQPPAPTSTGSVTILLMGVDARDGEAIDVGVRPDSLFVLHINGEEKSCRTLSIPRDTRVNLPGYGMSKINHALDIGGVPYQTLVVEQLLGIQVDHFGLLDFGGLVGVVNVIGGVTVTNEMEFTYRGVTFPQGELKLDGEDALLYARYRGGQDGDFGRQSRQQQIVRAVLDQTGGMDAAKAIPEVLNDIDGHFKTDLGVTNMISLANDYRSTCTAESLQTAKLSGDVGYDHDDLLDLDLSFVHVATTELSSKVEWLLNGTPAPVPGSQRAVVDPMRRGVEATLAPRFTRTAV